MRHDQIDRELEPLARALGELGQAEGASRRPGLEDRVFEASRAALQRQGGSEVVVLARLGWARSALKIAAAIALLGGIGFVAWSVGGGPAPSRPGTTVARGPGSAAAPAATARVTSTEDDDLTLIASSAWDDATRSEIDSLFSEAHELDASLSKAFTPGLGLLDGGAM